jgi:hypothetical protein
MRLKDVFRAVEAELSHSEIDDELREAVGEANPGMWVCIRDVYDDRFVYSLTQMAGPDSIDTGEPELFQATYTIDATSGEATVADPVEVERVVTYVPVAADATESKRVQVRGDPLKIIEAKGQKRTIKVIQPGWGSSGHYSKEVIKRDAPKTWPAGTHMYIAHPTEAEAKQANLGRSVEKLAAVLDTPATYDEHGPDGPGAYAKVTVAAPYIETIDSLAEDIGTSVYATGDATFGEAEGRKGPIFERLWSAEEDPFSSVDFVPKAGAGGKVLAAIEGLTRKPAAPAPKPATDDGQATHDVTETVTPKEGAQMDEVKLQEQLTAAETKTVQLQENVTKLETENGVLRGRVALQEATAVVAKALEGSDLPQITKDRISEAAVKGAKLDEAGVLNVAAIEAAVTEAAKAEAEYLATVNGSGTVHGQGASEAEVTEAKTKLEESFAHLLGDPNKAKVAAAGRN